MSKEKIYLCDIDKTIADNSHRSPYDEDKVLADKPLPTCQLIKALVYSGNKVVFLSGRSTKCYADTCNWIKEHIGIDPELYMRHSGDQKSDQELKKELYDTFIKEQYEVIAVFDDRLRVCKMWWDLGLFVFNCNQGNIEF